MTPERLQLNLPSGYITEIAPWIAALEDMRHQTCQAVALLDQAQLDYLPSGFSNSIGTLLAHIAAVELGWLYGEVLEAEFPAEAESWFATERDEAGQLLPVVGQPLPHHLARLAFVREHLLRVFGPMTLEDFRHPRQLPDYHVTPEWVLYHLLEHEAGHLAQIRMIRKRL